MELPIRLIIVLFVALLVASLLLVFAKDTIGDARKNLDQLNIEKKQGEEKPDQNLKIDTLTTKQLESLIRECYKMGKKELNSFHCFSIKSLNPPTVDLNVLAAVDLNKNNQTDDVEIDPAALATGRVWIEYNIVTGKVEVG